MVEVTATYDFFPNIDQQAYGALAKRVIDTLLKAPGFVELRANRNLMASPQVRATYVFQTMADWANFVESAEYRALDTELRLFVTNLKVDIWGPSPVVPEPIRP
jgi:hypothetical protein